MKTIAIELEKIPLTHVGLGNFCFNFAQSLSNQKKLAFKPLFMTRNKSDLRNTTAQCCHKKLYKFHRAIPQLAPRADLWHLTHQDSRYLPPKSSIPLILTIHDLNFLYTHKNKRRIEARLKRLQKLINRAQHITTISQAALDDIQKHLDLNIPATVIYNGVTVAPPCQTKPSFITDQPFILSVAQITKKKNLHVLLNLLLSLPNYNLILAGDNQDEYSRHIQSQANSMGLASRLIMPGRVTEAVKSWLYENCDAFCFPSLAEGFGLPVIEALHFNKPVFLSNIAAHHDIARDCAYYFGNYNQNEMKATFDKGLLHHQSDRTKSEKINLLLKKYKWDTNIREYIEIYHNNL